MAKLDIDERLAHITEEQGRIVADVIQGTLFEIGVPYHDVGPILARRLRAVSAGGAS